MWQVSSGLTPPMTLGSPGLPNLMGGFNPDETCHFRDFYVTYTFITVPAASWQEAASTPSSRPRIVSIQVCANSVQENMTLEPLRWVARPTHYPQRGVSKKFLIETCHIHSCYHTTSYCQYKRLILAHKGI